MLDLMQSLLQETVFECITDEQPAKVSKIVYENGNVYNGEIHNIFQKPNGPGTLKTSKATKTGLFRNGVFLCGVSTHQNGVVHTGSWEKGKKAGQGSIKCANGDYYEGYFINNLYQGQGKLIYRTGSVYQGNFKKGVRDGKGTYHCYIGDIKGFSYQGQWKDDCFHGQGVLKYHNGDIYKGAFVRNNKQGQGFQYMLSGDIFEGGFHNNLYEGYGRLALMGGKLVYQGQFKQGMFHGQGRIESPEGKFDRIFQKGRPRKKENQLKNTEGMGLRDSIYLRPPNNEVQTNQSEGKAEMKLSIVSEDDATGSLRSPKYD